MARRVSGQTALKLGLASQSSSLSISCTESTLEISVIMHPKRQLRYVRPETTRLKPVARWLRSFPTWNHLILSGFVVLSLCVSVCSAMGALADSNLCTSRLSKPNTLARGHDEIQLINGAVICFHAVSKCLYRFTHT